MEIIKEKRNCLICKHCIRQRGLFRCEFKNCNMGENPYYNDNKANKSFDEFKDGFKVCEFIPKFNMYSDSKFNWSIGVGCEFNCIYCKPSFQAQMKRQMPMIDKNGKKRGCQECYDYIPHVHLDRLNQKLPKTKGDEFIRVCLSGDISFIEPEFMRKIIEKVKSLEDRTFFFQTKDPSYFSKFKFPENCILGITLETNRDKDYRVITQCKAPKPSERYREFLKYKFERKSITIEPILEFDPKIFLSWLKKLEPERIYLGFNTKKIHLDQPSLSKTLDFIDKIELELPNTKLKLKSLKRISLCKNKIKKVEKKPKNLLDFMRMSDKNE